MGLGEPKREEQEAGRGPGGRSRGLEGARREGLGAGSGGRARREGQGGPRERGRGTRKVGLGKPGGRGRGLEGVRRKGQGGTQRGAGGHGGWGCGSREGGQGGPGRKGWGIQREGLEGTRGKGWRAREGGAGRRGWGSGGRDLGGPEGGLGVRQSSAAGPAHPAPSRRPRPYGRGRVEEGLGSDRVRPGHSLTFLPREGCGQGGWLPGPRRLPAGSPGTRLQRLRLVRGGRGSQVTPGPLPGHCSRTHAPGGPSSLTNLNLNPGPYPQALHT